MDTLSEVVLRAYGIRFGQFRAQVCRQTTGRSMRPGNVAECDFLLCCELREGLHALNLSDAAEVEQQINAFAGCVFGER